MIDFRLPHSLPIPEHYDPQKVGEIWRVPYQERAVQASSWAKLYEIPVAAKDSKRVALIAVDVQNTFCIPGFELFTGGRSGVGAVDDNRRLCEFLYQRLNLISQVIVTMDSHHAMQIFHPIFLVDDHGEHPGPVTLVSAEDVRSGKWRFNPLVAPSLGIDPAYGQRQLEHYTEELDRHGKFNLTIWPYHAMVGGIGHALVSAFEEAVFFHTIARNSQAIFDIKGDHPLTENYSVIRPEVLRGPSGENLAKKNERYLKIVQDNDAVLIVGQAKSHCVSWTIDDLLEEIKIVDSSLASKVYLLEDCMSSVVVPGVIDFTDQAEESFSKFAAAGMHRVMTSEPVENWLF